MFYIMITQLLCFVLLSLSIQCKVLPKYVTKCSIGDADKFSHCVLNNAKAVFPLIVNGDKSHKIPNLNPLFIEKLDLNSSPSLNLTLHNVSLEGLPTVDFTSVKFIKDEQKFVFELFFDYLKFKSFYIVNGKILVLPISGSGNGFIDFQKAKILFSCNMKKIQSKKGEVIRIENPNVETNFGNVVMYLDNLFNGKKVLGDEINKFLNENWKDVITEFQVLVTGTLSSIFSSIMGSFLNDLKFDAAFDDAE
ncbi:hypothetical protein WA026_010024 [Henosepilachna vigintioctopunctata]|uniref:Uncharacterized protein n=1 Tax=Henosepilachna vigintioctopunctata TaxID=420089 RepID=A0AAW1UG70_9CUCU